jgi:hypothetical protein
MWTTANRRIGWSKVSTPGSAGFLPWFHSAMIPEGKTGLLHVSVHHPLAARTRVQELALVPSIPDIRAADFRKVHRPLPALYRLGA